MHLFKSPNQSLRWLLAELAVVVLGILIAFQIEVWRNALSDRADERSALESIAVELKSDIASIDRVLLSQERMSRGLSTLTNLLEQKEEPSITHLAQAFVDLTIVDFWNPTAPTYQGLKENSRLRLISDSQLRSDLYTYYEVRQPYIDSFSQNIISARDRVNDEGVQDFYHAVLGSKSNDQIQIVEEKRPLGSPISIAVVLPIAEIPRNPVFAAAIGGYDATIRASLNLYILAKEEALDLLQAIQSQLE